MQEGDVLDRRFQLEAIAGAGAMGVVFRAIDLSRGTTVAVKVLKQADATDVARFEREAEVLVALQHPNVVRYVAQGLTPSNEPFLVMEWLAGETLKDRIARGPLTTLEAIDVGLALASALAGAHGRAVVHRDVKPANVFLVGGSARVVKLLDFGVASLRRRRALTEQGALVGTPAYMSPEQARGDEVDARSDVFSLGATMFHCIARVRPFEGQELLEIVLRILRERAPALASKAPGAPPELARLVDAMLDPDPAGRPTPGAISSALGTIRAALAPSHTASHVVPIAPKVTLVQPAPTRTTPGPTAFAPAAASRTAPPAEATPTRSRSLVLPIVIGGGVLAAGVAIVIGIVAARGTASAKKARRASASAMASARTAPRPPESTRISDLFPKRAEEPKPGALTCDPGMFEMCERITFHEPTIDTDEFLDFCVRVARRYEPTADLVDASLSITDGRVDLLAKPLGLGICGFVTATGRHFQLTTAGGLLQLVKGASAPYVSKDEVALPEDRCPFAKVWAASHVQRGAPILSRLTHVNGQPVWMMFVAGDSVSRVHASTCAAF